MSKVGSVTEVHLLRHGECEGGHMFRGKTDVPLTAYGQQQMQLAFNYATERLQANNASWDVIVASPLQRCHDFAKEKSRDNNIAFVVEPDLREMDFGVWDGCLINDIHQQYPEAFNAWLKNPMEFTPPNAESLAQVDARVQKALDGLLNQFEGQRVLLVTHGGIIRVLLAQILSMSARAFRCMDVPYACLSSFTCYHDPDGSRNVSLTAHNYTLMEMG